jgi:hypothetical protein
MYAWSCETVYFEAQDASGNPVPGPSPSAFSFSAATNLKFYAEHDWQCTTPLTSSFSFNYLQVSKSFRVRYEASGTPGQSTSVNIAPTLSPTPSFTIDAANVSFIHPGVTAKIKYDGPNMGAVGNCVDFRIWLTDSNGRISPRPTPTNVSITFASMPSGATSPTVYSNCFDPANRAAMPGPTPSVTLASGQTVLGNLAFIPTAPGSYTVQLTAPGTSLISTPVTITVNTISNGGAVDIWQGNPAQWAIHKPSFTGPVFASVSDGNGGWYVGGNFSNFRGSGKSHLVHILPNGEVDPGFGPNPNGPVHKLLLDGSQLYVGGAFTSINGQARGGLAAVLASTGASSEFNGQLTTTVSGAQVNVNALAKISDKLVVAGNFTSVGGQTRSQLAAFDVSYDSATNTYSHTLSNWSPNPNGQVYALAANGTHLYVGGAFTSVLGQTWPYFAAFDVSHNSTTNTYSLSLSGWFTSPDNGPVYALAANGTHLYVGGAFTTVGGSSHRYLARYNTGTNPPTLQSDLPSIGAITGGSVTALALDGNKLYIGGSFSQIASFPRSGLAAINIIETPTLDSWAPKITGSNLLVRTLAPSSSGMIFVGGVFQSLGGP